ncbi:MAG: hypothetical protein ABIW84_02120 [Ilumatobacteraceae bacterium]
MDHGARPPRPLAGLRIMDGVEVENAAKPDHGAFRGGVPFDVDNADPQL